MKQADFNAAMTMLAEADQRATANLVELIAATALRKLTPPDEGAVVSVTISPDDVEEMLQSHYFESRYDGSTMAIFLTRSEITSEAG